jgi:periplasmic protein TonB
MKGLQHIDELDEIIFEERNKAYGAYNIRQMYNSNVTKGMLISVLLLLLGVSIPLLANYLNKKFYIDNGPDVTVTMGPTIRPPDDEELKPPPEIPKPLQIEKQIAYIPEIVDDTNANGTMFVQEDVNNKNTYVPPADTTLDIPDDPNRENPIDYDKTDNTIQQLSAIQEKPQFPGGEDAMVEFISKNIRYPEMASRYGIQGKVYVSFIVEKDGKLSNFEIAGGVGAGCDEEALRVVKMMPDWSPGMQNNHPVRVQMNLPVKFVILH